VRVLFPTDGSDNSEMAAKFLLRLALSSRDEIYVLHAICDDPLQASDEYYTVKLREVKKAIAPQIVTRALDILKPLAAKVEPLIVSGDPDACIVETAANRDVDLVVMGPKRAKGIQSRIVGSVTKSVTIQSTKPVLVVKPSPDEIAGRLKILFATDGSDHARRAADIVMSIPFLDDVSVTVLHVVTPALYDVPKEYRTIINSDAERDLQHLVRKDLEIADSVLARAKEDLQKRFPKVEGISRVGDPIDEILQMAAELKPDIIVLGSKGMGGFRGVVGSISRYIVSVAECSVLIGKTARVFSR